MANLSWYEAFGAADCVSGHATWNDMTDYIKHSACTDFTIHSTCTSGGQAFKFTQAGVISKSYGGADTGDDRQWFANSTDAYPYIEGLGSSHLKLYSGDDIYFYDNAEQAFKFSQTGAVSEIYGGADTGDDLLLQANTTNTYPIVSFLGDKYVYMQSDLSYVVTTARIPIFSEIAAARADECLNRMRQEFGHELWADPYYDSGDAHGEGANAFMGGILAPNGKIILVPCGSANVGIYDPDTDIYTSGDAHGEGGSAFVGGILAPNGKIILIPRASDNVGIYDPDTDTYTRGDTHGEGTAAFTGGVLAPSGKVIFIPYNSDNVGIYNVYAEVNKNTCLHPIFNKF